MQYITAVLDSTVQGHSKPYICLADDGRQYFVKGLRSTRQSQINEWLCANMAQALGLPVAPFTLLDMPDYLYDELLPEQQGIGMGATFASLAINNANLLEVNDIAHIDIGLQMCLAAFDWLVCNMDRTVANPNLLMHNTEQNMVVIDHNLAFDSGFNTEDFRQTHIFKAAFAVLSADIPVQNQINEFLMPALAAWQNAYQTLPPEWAWINNEQDVPCHYDFDFARVCLGRLTLGTLWESAQ